MRRFLQCRSCLSGRRGRAPMFLKEGRRMKTSVRVLALAIAAALTLFAAACGSSDDDRGGGGGSKAKQASGGEIKPGKKGGTLNYLAASDVDYLDTGQTYYTFGYMVAY